MSDETPNPRTRTLRTRKVSRTVTADEEGPSAPSSSTRARPYPSEPKKARMKAAKSKSKGKKSSKSRKSLDEPAEHDEGDDDGDGEAEEPEYETQPPPPEEDVPTKESSRSSRRRGSKRSATAEGEADEPESAPADAATPGSPLFHTTMPIVVAPRPRDHSPATHREQIGNLASLADAAEGNTARPPYPYSTLIRYAIAGSERGKMTLSDLYGKIEDRFPYFKAAGGGWKNSIRHNLSLNKNFVKVARPLTEPGKGSYWMINPEKRFEDGPVRPSRVGKEGEDGAESLEPPPKKRSRTKPRPQLDDPTATEAASPDAGDSAASPDVAYANGYYGSVPPDGHGHYDPRGYYADPYQQVPYQPPYGPPQPNMDGGNDVVYPPPPGPEGYYYPQYPPPMPPPPQGFVDDRPDRNAPRTIYNHAAGYGGEGAGALGALATSTPYGVQGHAAYYRYAAGAGGYTSSLGGAMGPSVPITSSSVRGLTEGAGEGSNEQVYGTYRDGADAPGTSPGEPSTTS